MLHMVFFTILLKKIRKVELDLALKEVDRQKEEAVIFKRAKDVAEAQAEEAR